MIPGHRAVAKNQLRLRDEVRLFLIGLQVESLNSASPYWWQWFTILSMDAVAVSLAWQWLFARLANVTLSAATAIVLGLSVWLAYTADRWIEGWRLMPERVLTHRHLFALRWRWTVFTLWCILFLADIAIAKNALTHREFYAGFLLLIPVLIYLLSHQFLHRKSAWRLPKEICVAALLVGGITLFVAANLPTIPDAFWILAVSFGTLCFVNLALISLWEKEVDAVQGQDSLARKWTNANRATPLLPWACAVLSLLAAIWERTSWQAGFFCVAASSILLGCISLCEKRWGRQLARTSADVVLLTPLLPLLFNKIGA